MCQAGAAPKALDLAAMMLKKAGAGDLTFHPVRFMGIPEPKSIRILVVTVTGWGVDSKLYMKLLMFVFFPVFLNEL